MARKLSQEKENQILREAKDRLKKAMDYDDENRKMALEDLKFVAEEKAQWPEDVRSTRESNGQPCLTINKMPTFIDQVVGDQRMNRPSIKVIPVDSKGDPKVARILAGWIKHVEQISDSDIAIDHAFEHGVTCGYGALRVVTNYVSEDSFDQEAYIEKIDNALAVYWGHHTKYDCSDAEYCFVITEMDRDEFKDKYDEDPMPFSAVDSQYSSGWATKNTVKVAEYFIKEHTEKDLYMLADGTVVNKLESGQKYTKKRTVDSVKIMWYLLTGDKVLDCKEWAGRKYIPVVPFWGKEFNVGGKRYVRGLVRNGKDSQRIYNYWQSCDTEVVALQPRSPYMLTPKQIEGHETMWNTAGKKSNFYLLVNPDKDINGAFPQRQMPPQASTAMVEKIAMADQDMRDTMGLQKAALGMQSNERSGAAIRERKQEGDTGTFAFIDNLARTLEYLGRILVDIAPVILDTERVIRLGLDDGKFDFDAINVKGEDGKIINDLSVGIYDVVVAVGPSFTTQRTEARQSMQEFIQYYPQAAPIIGDLYARSSDWPGAEEFAERLEEILPPEIRAKVKAKRAKIEGIPSEEQEQLQPPQPDPITVMKIQQEEAKLKEAQLQVAQEAEKLKALQIKTAYVEAQSKEAVAKMVEDIINEKLTGGQNAEGNQGGAPVRETQSTGQVEG